MIQRFSAGEVQPGPRTTPKVLWDHGVRGTAAGKA